MSTVLQTVPLGTTDMAITRVGFGAWAVGGAGTFGWGEQDDSESTAAIRHAVESGVNWVDTAAIYGLGHSETVVAQALKDVPEADRPYVFTKGGLVWDESNRALMPRRVGDAASLRREVEASLRRLDVERIDLYQMHWPADDGTTVQDYWPVFLDLVAEGKVRAVGLSNHSIAQLEAAEALGHVGSVQPPLNLIHREAAAEEIPWCAARGTGVIVYSPMASGLLTGSFTVERAATLDEGDWRRASPDFNGEGLRHNLDLVDALRPIAERHAVSVGAVAIAWTLTFPGVTGAIVGARRPAQVDGWLPAAQLTLDERDLDDITTALASRDSGPRGPVA